MGSRFLHHKNIVLDLAPSAAERPLTIGVNDTLIGIPTALLVGAGALIDLVGFAPIYVGIAALTLLGVVLAGRLPTAAHQAEAINPFTHHSEGLQRSL